MHEGYTTAGGFEIMINCDFSIASEDAKIGDFHIRRALFGGAGPIYRVPRILGERRAKELMLTGKLLTGREAYEWGLVNDVAPAEELDECVDSFVAQLADKSPFQMAITKMTLNRGLDADTETHDARRAARGRRHAQLERRGRRCRGLPREARSRLDRELSRQPPGQLRSIPASNVRAPSATGRRRIVSESTSVLNGPE